MQLGVIVETNDPKQVWNALNFSVTALKKGHATHLLSMGAAVQSRLQPLATPATTLAARWRHLTLLVVPYLFVKQALEFTDSSTKPPTPSLACPPVSI